MPIARCGVQFSWGSSSECKNDDPECIGCPIKKKRIKLYNIQNVPVDEEKLRNDRRNS